MAVPVFDDDVMEIPLKATQVVTTKPFDPYWIKGHKLQKLKTMNYDNAKKHTLLGLGIVIGYDKSKKRMTLYVSDTIIENLKRIYAQV